MISKTIKLYDERDDVTLTAFIHESPAGMYNEEKRPAVIVCPGGGYLHCSDREAEPVALKFLTMGYHAFVLRYSTYSNNSASGAGSKKVLEINKNSLYPAQLLELARSFIILNENSLEWNLDTDKIAICGFSAGAHNCAMYSVYWNSDEIINKFSKPPEVFRPAASILCYPLCSFESMFDMSKEEALHKAVSIAYLGTENPDRQTLLKVSPVRHVTKNTPPTFIWTTAEDMVVPANNSLEMSKALSDAGVPFELHVFQEGQHGMGLATKAFAGKKEEVNDNASKWIDLAEAWLKKRFEE